MTLAELDEWQEDRNWGASGRAELAEDPNGFPVFFADSRLCLEWANVKVAARRRGRQIDTADAWIAATALLYQAPLITHNCPGGVFPTGMVSTYGRKRR